MTPAHTSNTFTSGQWVRVVSGLSWAEYKLSAAGTVTAEIVRGPLIMRATKPSEGEGLPNVQPPTLTPLEEQTAKVNTRAAFERFERAAHGKVRPSVRWKTGWKWRERCAAGIFLVFFSPEHALMFTESDDRLIVRAGNSRRAQPGVWEEAANWYEVSCSLGLSEFNEEIIFKELERALKEFRRKGVLPAVSNGYNVNLGRPVHCYMSVGSWLRALSLHAPFLSEVLAALKSRRTTLAILLKHLEDEAYRAHLTRRVKPVQRRTRAPRPLYARPRPPTAPLAPPVA